jgi:hypothetical protein
MIAAACQPTTAGEKFVYSSSRLGVAEGVELETNILSQNFARLRAGLTEPKEIAACRGNLRLGVLFDEIIKP